MVPVPEQLLDSERAAAEGDRRGHNQQELGRTVCGVLEEPRSLYCVDSVQHGAPSLHTHVCSVQPHTLFCKIWKQI